MSNPRLLTDAEIQEATGKSPAIPGAKFWVGDELKLATIAQDAKTAATMQAELDAQVSLRIQLEDWREGYTERIDALRARGQALADLLKEVMAPHWWGG